MMLSWNMIWLVSVRYQLNAMEFGAILSTTLSPCGLTLSHACGTDAYTYEACPLVQLRPSVLPHRVLAACLWH